MIDSMEARVTTRGRVTIPIELRRKFGITPGTRLIVREEDGHIVMMTMAGYVRSLRGVLRGGKGMQALQEERRDEALREDQRFGRKTAVL